MFNVMVSTRFQLAVLSCAFWPCQLGNEVPSFQQLDKYQVRRIPGPSLAIAGSSSFISRYKMWDRIRIKILGSAQVPSLEKMLWYFYMQIQSSFGIQVTHLELHCSTPCTDRSRMSLSFGHGEGILSAKSEHQGTFKRLPLPSFLVTLACQQK